MKGARGGGEGGGIAMGEGRGGTASPVLLWHLVDECGSKKAVDLHGEDVRQIKYGADVASHCIASHGSAHGIILDFSRPAYLCMLSFSK